jgi:hypothetical protein
MKIIEDDKRGRAGTNSYAVIIDINRRNKENIARFSDAQRLLADRLRELASIAHDSTVYSPNFRKGQISVKVAMYRTRDKMRPGYLTLMEFCEKNSIDIRYTASGGVIYSIK